MPARAQHAYGQEAARDDLSAAAEESGFGLGAFALEIDDATFFVYFTLGDGQGSIKLTGAPLRAAPLRSRKPRNSTRRRSRSFRTRACFRPRLEPMSVSNTRTRPSSHVRDGAASRLAERPPKPCAAQGLAQGRPCRGGPRCRGMCDGLAHVMAGPVHAPPARNPFGMGLRGGCPFGRDRRSILSSKPASTGVYKRRSAV